MLVRAVVLGFLIVLAGTTAWTRTESRDSVPPGTNAAPAAEKSAAATPIGTGATSGGYVLVPVAALPQISKPAEVPGPWPGFWAMIGVIFAAIAWPIAAIILVYRVLKAPQIDVLLTKLYQRTSQITIAGLEIKLNDGATATLDDLQTLIAKVPSTQQDWVNNSHLEDQFRYVVYGLRSYFCQENNDFPRALPVAEFAKTRFTLHVPDVLLTHSLRQLVDYMGCGRGGAGRLFSSRRGITGLAWRLEESQHLQQTYTEEDLVTIWGMTRAEAADTSSSKSLFMTFILKSEQGLPLAILYADAESNALFDAQRISPHTTEAAFRLIEREVWRLSVHCGLTASLQNLEEARVKIKQVDVYQTDLH